MFPSWRLALDNLAGRPPRGLRAALLTTAVVLAAALLVAVSTTIHSGQQHFEAGLNRVLGPTDARIIHPFNGRFDAALLDTVRTWPGIVDAAGRHVGSLTLIRADGRTDPDTGRPLRTTSSANGVDFDREFEFQTIDITEGRLPTAPHEVLIDPITADALDAGIEPPGNQLVVQRFGPPIELTVTGIYQRRRLGALQRPRIFVHHDVISDATGRADQLSMIAITLEDGIDVSAFCSRHAEAIPEPLMLEPAEMAKTGFRQRVFASRIGLLFASVLTFMSAAFIIVTGMTTAVTERQREIAILRCIGGSRRQLFAAQLWVGLIIGTLGAAIGIPLGLGLSAALLWWFSDIVPIALQPSTFGIQLTAIGAIGAGLIGGAYPAVLATRVPPLVAMTRQAQPLRWSALALVTIIAGACLLAQAALLAIDDTQQRFWSYIAVGVPVVHIGYFLLGPAILTIAAVTMAPALSRILKLPANLLGRTLLATPYRYGFTAAALMVGMSILVSTWSNGTSLLRDWIGTMRFADGFALRTTGIPPAQQRAIAELPFITQTCTISYLPLRIIGQQVFGVEGVAPPNVVCFGFDPHAFFEMNAVTWLQGDPDHAIPRLLEGDAIIVAEQFLTARDIGVGETLRLGSGRVEIDFEIVGVVESTGLDVATQLFGIRSVYLEQALSSVFMDVDAVRRHFDFRDAVIIQVNLNDTVTDEEAEAAIEDTAPGVRFRSGRWIRERIDLVAGVLLAVYSTVAFCALVLACFGVGNVIVANIRTRNFEYGVLRAAGAQRAMLMKLILGEAAVIALVGAAIGIALGLHLATVSAGFYRDLAGLSLRVPVPVLPIAIGVAVTLVLTLAAATWPAVSLIRTPLTTLLALGRNG